MSLVENQRGSKTGGRVRKTGTPRPADHGPSFGDNYPDFAPDWVGFGVIDLRSPDVR
jgi:hypothetical protein